MTFRELGVNETLCKAIEEMGFTMPMPVQEAVIPLLVSPPTTEGGTLVPSATEECSASQANQHKQPNVSSASSRTKTPPSGVGGLTDLIALAQTGTGKTAAFGLPLLQGLDLSTRETQAVIMSPTRELCLQICDDLKDFGKYMEGLHITAVYGGAPLDSQIRQLRKGSQVIVATPGRLVDLIERGVADITTASTIVLDEADEMLNMGFSDAIDFIFENVITLPRDGWGGAVLMFSATMSKEVEQVAKKYLHEYQEIVVGSRNEGAENVDHTYYMVHAKDKYLALKRIVDYYPKIYAIIFCRTKVETQDIADKLIRDGYNAESLHGDLSQPQRDQTMQKFRQHTVQLLVATDVAARGLDVNDLTHVINYGMPDDTESYTHRSGRTGRAGKKGSSIAIIHSRELFKIRDVEKAIQKKFVRGTLPSPQEICKKQLFRVMDHITKVDVDDETIEPFMDEIQRHFEYFEKDEIIKKIVMMEFSKFLEYYANAPEIEEVQERVQGSKFKVQGSESKCGRRKGADGHDRGPEHKAEAGYSRLFINLGKAEGFYPGEVMQFINQHVSGRGKGGEAKRQEVGHIDLMSHYCFIEVPDRDAQNVMAALDGTNYHGRPVRCNAEDSGKAEGTFDVPIERKPRGKGRNTRREEPRKRRDDGSKILKPSKKRNRQKGEYTADDWRSLISGRDFKFRGEEPDFSEEGWARRDHKKKK